MTRPEIHFASRHSSGNIFVILGLVREALRKQRRYTEFNDLMDRVQQQMDYKSALDVIREKVDLIDDDGIY